MDEHVESLFLSHCEEAKEYKALWNSLSEKLQKWILDVYIKPLSSDKNIAYENGRNFEYNDYIVDLFEYEKER